MSGLMVPVALNCEALSCSVAATTGNRFGAGRVNSAAISPRVAGATAGRNNTAFNRSNRYGGNWYAANSHAGWSRGGDHFWNGHHYRWYDGGWLIVDNGFWPFGYPYPYYGYGYYDNQPAAVGDSIAANVQSSLAQQGYYNGPIDGDIGPRSRQAIAEYQGDHGLPVSGVIDQPLLQSLGLA